MYAQDVKEIDREASCKGEGCGERRCGRTGAAAGGCRGWHTMEAVREGGAAQGGAPHRPWTLGGTPGGGRSSNEWDDGSVGRRSALPSLPNTSRVHAASSPLVIHPNHLPHGTNRPFFVGFLLIEWNIPTVHERETETDGQTDRYKRERKRERERDRQRDT